MRTYNTKIHTIFLLVGPSGCGKTTFSKECLIPSLRNSSERHLNIQYIGSDDIRREILGDPGRDKYDDSMVFASEEAFSLLNHKIDLVTTYPVNADFVIVDTTGLSKDFRSSISSYARKNNYNVDVVMFAYKNNDEYLKNLDEDSYDQKVVFNHIKRMNKNVYKEVKGRDFNNVHKIKSKDFSEIEFGVSNMSFYDKCLLPDDNTEYVVMGDIHGCFDEFILLLGKNGFIVNPEGFIEDREGAGQNRKILLVGDYIDKGPKIKETVDFIHRNVGWFKIVLGNHENFVFKFLKGKISADAVPKEILRKYFNSIHLFEHDGDFKEKLNDLVVNHSFPFLKHKYFVVTHAPCDKKYLSKLDRVSVKKQLKFDSPRRADFDSNEAFQEDYEKQVSFLEKDSVRNQPYHIFGHDSYCKVFNLKNKIGLDTGCSSGGKLSSVIINGRYKPCLKGIPSLQEKTKDFFTPFSGKPLVKEVAYFDLTPRERFRVSRILDNKVNFISGTMCPSDKDEATGDLESMGSALSYYKAQGVKEVILQTKYMGSRGTIYLFKNKEECFATSRSGVVIKADITPIYVDLLSKYLPEMEKNNEKLRIIDAEIMPWYAMGKGLIESEFSVVASGIESELDFLKENGFEDKLAELGLKYDLSKFKEDSHTSTAKDLVQKYGSNVYGNFKCYPHLRGAFLPIDYQEELLGTYKRQLVIYGSDGDIHAKPFALLKTVFEDDTEETYFERTNEFVFKAVSDDPYLVVDLGDEDALTKAEAFYAKVTTVDQKEGLVVKPNDKVYTPFLAPYTKVRNKDYLTIVYGYDYRTPRKFERLMRQKKTNRKRSLSIKEFAIGKAMLDVPWNSINPDNRYYEKMVINMIAEEKKETSLDPRL